MVKSNQVRCDKDIVQDIATLGRTKLLIKQSDFFCMSSISVITWGEFEFQAALPAAREQIADADCPGVVVRAAHIGWHL